MEELAPYISPIVTGLIAAIGVYVAMSNKIAVLETLIKTLSEKVEKHNNMIERIYRLESKVDELERKVG